MFRLNNTLTTQTDAYKRTRTHAHAQALSQAYSQAHKQVSNRARAARSVGGSVVSTYEVNEKENEVCVCVI